MRAAPASAGHRPSEPVRYPRRSPRRCRTRFDLTCPRRRRASRRTQGDPRPGRERLRLHRRRADGATRLRPRRRDLQTAVRKQLVGRGLDVPSFQLKQAAARAPVTAQVPHLGETRAIHSADAAVDMIIRTWLVQARGPRQRNDRECTVDPVLLDGLGHGCLP